MRRELMQTIAIIGAGASGSLCAVEIRRRHPDWRVMLLEAGKRPMAKLALTGGGRCNITNSFGNIRAVKEAYPRGYSVMKRLLKSWPPRETLAWFEREGIRFTTQEDGCVFPCSQDAMQIVSCLERLIANEGVELRCGVRITRIEALRDGGFTLHAREGGRLCCDKLVLCAGGSSAQFLGTLLPEDVEIVPTVPSLFTFRLEDGDLSSLMGTVLDSARLSIPGSGISSEGTLLITDWGLSGPAALKLSSYAAVLLSWKQYRCPLVINWTGMDEESQRRQLELLAGENPRKLVAGAGPGQLSARLWKYLCGKAGIPGSTRWSELGGRQLNRLVSRICAFETQIVGRAKFKEEFVTAGGVALSGVDPTTMQSRQYPGLYFAGEVLDIDAITGGFNLQAAWSTAFAVAEHI